jgi:hypothetical protein
MYTARSGFFRDGNFLRNTAVARCKRAVQSFPPLKLRKISEGLNLS